MSPSFLASGRKSWRERRVREEWGLFAKSPHSPRLLPEVSYPAETISLRVNEPGAYSPAMRHAIVRARPSSSGPEVPVAGQLQGAVLYEPDSVTIELELFDTPFQRRSLLYFQAVVEAACGGLCLFVHAYVFCPVQGDFRCYLLEISRPQQNDSRHLQPESCSINP